MDMKVIVTQDELHELAAQYVEGKLGLRVNVSQFVWEEDNAAEEMLSCEVSLEEEGKEEKEEGSLLGRRVKVLIDVDDLATKGVEGTISKIDDDGDVWILHEEDCICNPFCLTEFYPDHSKVFEFVD